MGGLGGGRVGEMGGIGGTVRTYLPTHLLLSVFFLLHLVFWNETVQCRHACSMSPSK